MNYKLFLPVILAFALVFAVSAVGVINIAESNIAVSGEPGGINNTEYFTVQNIGGDSLSGIVINASDLTGGGETIPSSALNFVPDSLDLASGSDSAVAVILNFPPGQKAGTYMGTANAVYNNTNKDSLSLIANVLPVPGYTASADSADISQGSSDYITVNVTNTGNADISGLSYQVSDPFTSGSDNLDVTSSPTGSISVLYGSSNTFQIHFSPSGSQPAGTYSGEVNISYSGVDTTLPLTVSVHEPVKSLSLSDVVFPESDRQVNVTKDVTVKNTGDVTLTGVSLTHTGSDVWVSGAVPGTLLPGFEFTVTVKAFVPEDADSGEDDVGTLKFRSNELNRTVDIKTNAESMLRFEDVEVSIDDKSWDNVESGDTADEDAIPGDRFQVRVKLENLFDDDEDETDLDLEDVEVNAVFHNAGEDGDDIEGDVEFDDIDASDESETEEIDFDDDNIDWDSDSGELLMELFASADDENGARHTASFNFTINVERDSKPEIIFTRLDASSGVQCGRSFVMYVEGRNVGEDADDEVVLKLKSSALGINIKEEFEMGAYDDDDCNALDRDEDDCTSFEYRKTVMVPSNIASGTYKIEAELFYDGGDDQTDEEDFDINVVCGDTSGSSGTSDDDDDGSASSGSDSSGTDSGSSGSTGTPSGSGSDSGSQASSTTSSVEVLYGGGSGVSSGRGAVATGPTKITDTTRSDSFTDSEGYLAVLSILSVLAIIGIIILLIYAFTSPKV